MKNKQESIIEQIKTKSISASKAKKYLYEAFPNQHADLAKLIINNYPELADRKSYLGSPLYYVLYIKDSEIRHELISLLLDKGADIDGRSKDNKTPLMVAFDRDQRETVDFLESKGSDINAKIGNLDFLSYNPSIKKESREKPYIQYNVDRYLSMLKLDEDNESIVQHLKKSYEFRYCNYDQIREKFDWYHSLSENYKDEIYRDKFHALLIKAKKDGIEYMLALKDLLNDCFQGNNFKSTLIKSENFDEEKIDLTNEKIEQLQNSIIDLLFIVNEDAYYIPIIMTSDKGIVLREFISESQDKHLLPFKLQYKIDKIIEYYHFYKQDPLIQLAQKAIDKEAKIEELKAELAELSKENIELKNKPTQQDISSQCKYISVINNAGQELSSSNSEEGNCEIKITGYTIEHTH